MVRNDKEMDKRCEIIKLIIENNGSFFVSKNNEFLNTTEKKKKKINTGKIYATPKKPLTTLKQKQVKLKILLQKTAKNLETISELRLTSNF